MAFDPRRGKAIDVIRAEVLVGPPLTQDVIEHGQDAVGHLSRPKRSSARAMRAVGAEVQAEVTLQLASRMGMQVTEVHPAPA
jgi:hypothetical protein